MEPTLKINDRVLVIKDTIVPLDIDSGDIVVFYNTDTEYSENLLKEYLTGLQIWNIGNINNQKNAAIIKRVVGVGGDKVEILENGEVFVNDNRFIILNINEGVNFKRETFLDNSVISPICVTSALAFSNCLYKFLTPSDAKVNSNS